MGEERLTVTIEKLAGLGDGVAQSGGRKLFVPYTVAGDVVQVRRVKRTTDADFAVPETILSGGADRVKPPCRHFGECGGCALQHVAGHAYRAFKRDMARAAVRKAGYDPACVEDVVGFPPASRRRVELKAVNAELGYFAERSHRLTHLKECAVLEPELEALVLRLQGYCKAWPRLQSVQINGLDSGYDVLLTGEGITQWPHGQDPAIRRVTARSAVGSVELHRSGTVELVLGGVAIQPPPGAFLQAVRAAQEVMTQRVVTRLGGRVLDLFAGMGTYSFPLARGAQVHAVEVDAPMVQAMREAATRAGLKAFRASRRDLFQDPVPEGELARYDGVVMNPPRAGAAAQSSMLARARVPRLVMISCNPATFARDARLLREGGYRLENATPIDQFTYSSHLEIMAEFAI